MESADRLVNLAGFLERDALVTVSLDHRWSNFNGSVIRGESRWDVAQASMRDAQIAQCFGEVWIDGDRAFEIFDRFGMPSHSLQASPAVTERLGIGRPPDNFVMGFERPVKLPEFLQNCRLADPCGQIRRVEFDGSLVGLECLIWVLEYAKAVAQVEKRLRVLGGEADRFAEI